MTMTTARSAAPRSTAAIIGGSLGGFAAAHALEQTGWQVDVLERSPTLLSTKGSGLGFVHVPAWESLAQQPMIRRNRRASRQQGSYYYGDLWKFLYENLNKHQQGETQVSVQFGTTIDKLEGSLDNPVVDGRPYDLVVVANGGFSNLRKHVVGDQQPEYAGYVVWRGSVSADKLPPQLLRDIQSMEGVYKDGIYDTIVLKMAEDSGEDLWTMGTFVVTPEEEVKQYWKQDQDGVARHGDTSSNQRNNHVPSWFSKHMAQHFGHVPGLMSLIEHMIKDGEIQAHPQYEFGARKVHKGRVILLGDAAHMASPRTAVGAHTAILDALALRDAMKTLPEQSTSDEDLDKAMELYGEAGLANAEGLYSRTREVSQAFVPAGGLSKIVSPARMHEEPDDKVMPSSQ